ATFSTKESDFLVSDNPDFHPTDVIEDADGSLLVFNTGGWYKLCCPTSQLSKPDVLGAVYRIRRSDAPRPNDPRGLALAWEKADGRELAKRLADERVAVRKRAIQELSKMGEKAVTPVVHALQSSESSESRRNAIWTLTRISGEPAREVVRRAINDREESV